MKNVFGSKTIWLNVLGMAAAVFIPQAQDAISTHPAIVTSIGAVANLALRFVTHQAISFNPNKSPFIN